jgi:hypothetical protein
MPKSIWPCRRLEMKEVNRAACSICDIVVGFLKTLEPGSAFGTINNRTDLDYTDSNIRGRYEI